MNSTEILEKAKNNRRGVSFDYVNQKETVSHKVANIVGVGKDTFRGIEEGQ